MSRQRHERVLELFEQACDLEPAEQKAFLDRMRDDEPDIARELASLLEQDRVAADSLDAFAQGPGFLALVGGMSVTTLDGGRAPSLSMQPLPDVPDLEIVAALAEGGMGRVLLARQRSLDREVAVKIVRSNVVSTLQSDGLFTEARLAGSLEHPNIVPIHLIAQDRNGVPVLVMKRVEGVSLRTLIDESNHPLWAQLTNDGGDRVGVCLSILSSICHALHFAHDRGVLHRDVKPDNIMVGRFGEVYLVDWGIAIRHSEGSVRATKVVGTPGFMAPEMARGTRQDARTDVYLLGATLHYVLTKSSRHTGSNTLARITAAMESKPFHYDSDVPEELAAICNRATHVDPERRHPTAMAFREAILEYIRHRGAFELTETANARLHEARALRVRSEKNADDERRLSELLTECQFAFQQALRTWPANTRAREGLEACFAFMIEHEVAGENLGRARLLLGQMAAPSAELINKVDELEAQIREREALAAQQRVDAYARDWSVAYRPRTIFLVCTCVASFVIWRIAVHDQSVNPHPIPPPLLVLYAWIACAVFAALIVIFRRRIFINDISRRIVLTVMCAIVTVALGRTLVLFPTTPTASIVSMDQVVIAGACAIAGVTIAPWIWIFAPILLASAFAGRLVPAHAGNMFAAASCTCAAIFFYIVRPR